MIPSCRGCQYELLEAFNFQEMGYDIGLEGMGERKHCVFFVLDKKGKFIVAIWDSENKK